MNFPLPQVSIKHNVYQIHGESVIRGKCRGVYDRDVFFSTTQPLWSAVEMCDQLQRNNGSACT